MGAGFASGRAQFPSLGSKIGYGWNGYLERRLHLGIIQGIAPNESQSAPKALTSRAARHPELIADESATAAAQDGRAAHPTCPVLHPAARRKLLDTVPVPADRDAYRAARVASDVIWSTVQRAGASERG